MVGKESKKEMTSLQVRRGEALVIIRCAECREVTTVSLALYHGYGLQNKSLTDWLEGKGWLKARPYGWYCPDCVKGGE